jgi:uncharacterized protein
MCEDPVIDVGEFAEGAGALEGKVAIASLARLCDLLAERAGEVAYGLRGYLDEDGRPRLRIEVTGRFALRCQRCLEPVVHVVASQREFRFLPDASHLPDVADEAAELDDLPLPAPMRVLDWVEDEILLALPIAPRHEEGECLAPKNPAAAPDTVGRPFAQIRELGFQQRKIDT